jgi:hypothetical protein
LGEVLVIDLFLASAVTLAEPPGVVVLVPVEHGEDDEFAEALAFEGFGVAAH